MGAGADTVGVKEEIARGVATSKILSTNEATCSTGRESAVEDKIILTLVGNLSKNN